MYLLLLTCFLKVVLCQRQPNIAVVGAGIGGSTTIHFLRQHFGDDVAIDVYEGRHVGGRLATVAIDGHEFEAGGAVIHPDNFYMNNFTKMFDLEKVTSDGDETFGLFDGKNIVFQGSSNSVILALQMLYRYGLDVFRIGTYVKELLTDFKRIYEHQSQGYSFTTVERLLSSMSPRFPPMLRTTLAEEMAEAGLQPLFVHDLVRGAMRTNYGQDLDTSAFVGAVSMAGIEPGLFRIKGGNKQVPEKLIQRARANVNNNWVKNITLTESKNKLSYSISSQTRNGDIVHKVYDIVIVATPLHDQLSRINFRGFEEPIGNFPQHFQHRPTLFIKGSPNPAYFGEQQSGNLPTEILTNKPDIKLCSMGKHRDVNGEEMPVYKIFTNELLSEHEVANIFPQPEAERLIDWQGAYPVYDKLDLPIPPFTLYKQLYYLNGMELAASAMEMSAVAGRNVAQLAYDNWHGKTEKIDNIDIIGEAFQRSQEINRNEL